MGQVTTKTTWPAKTLLMGRDRTVLYLRLVHSGMSHHEVWHKHTDILEEFADAITMITP
jgi:hypothetical protein